MINKLINKSNTEKEHKTVQQLNKRYTKDGRPIRVVNGYYCGRLKERQ